MDKKIELILNEDIGEKSLRSIFETKLDISELVKTINSNKNKIERIEFKINGLELSSDIKTSFEVEVEELNL